MERRKNSENVRRSSPLNSWSTSQRQMGKKKAAGFSSWIMAAGVKPRFRCDFQSVTYVFVSSYYFFLILWSFYGPYWLIGKCQSIFHSFLTFCIHQINSLILRNSHLYMLLFVLFCRHRIPTVHMLNSSSFINYFPFIGNSKSNDYWNETKKLAFIECHIPLRYSASQLVQL